MIIRDLSQLEVISEETQVEGAGNAYAQGWLTKERCRVAQG
jgi:hypothetical protein